METNIQKVIRYSFIIFSLKINIRELSNIKERLENISLKLSDTINHVSLSLKDLSTKVFDVQMEIKTLLIPLFKDKVFIGYTDPTSPHWALSKSEIDKGYLYLEQVETKESYILFLFDYKDNHHYFKEGDLVKQKEVAHILGNISYYKNNYKIRNNDKG